MAYSPDDDSELIPDCVTEYQFVNGKGDPIPFSDLPRFDKSQISSPVYLRGNTADRSHKVNQRVLAWKLELSASSGPEAFVSSKNGKWIKLLKPRKFYRGVIRTILITIHMLQFVKWHPNSSVMTLWNHLGRLFGKSEGSPSEDDVIPHLSFIQKFAEQDETLPKSRILRCLIGKNSTGTTPENKIDVCGDVCCICDNGGELVSCEGECMRSFHATKEAGEGSKCEGLGFSESQLEDITNFICKNCDLKQQQCFVCGKLGNSDITKDPEVFICGNARCGYFYHRKCMRGFVCPFHKCFVCKKPEQKDDSALEFAVCRRCPKSYHRKCLPRHEASKHLFFARSVVSSNRLTKSQKKSVVSSNRLTRLDRSGKEKKMRDWSEMQSDINRLIVSKLGLYPHQRKFASVSKEWYQITKEEHGPFQENYPFLLLPCNYETQTCMLYNVFESKMIEFDLPEIKGKFILSSSNGWLAVINKSNFKLGLVNPLTGKKIQLPEPTYAVEQYEIDVDPFDPFDPLNPSRLRLAFCKLVVSEDCRMISATMMDSSRLVVCRAGDDSWTFIDNPTTVNYQFYQNLVFFQGNLYATTYCGCVVEVDCSGVDFETHCIEEPSRSLIKQMALYLLQCYLVECSGDLLLVHKLGDIYCPQSTKIKFFLVYKLEKDKENWSRIHDLGDKSLFLGYNGSMCVSAENFHGCRPNSIYFANDVKQPGDYFHTWFEHENGVFSLEDNIVELFNIGNSFSLNENHNEVFNINNFFSLNDNHNEVFNFPNFLTRWQNPAMWFHQKI